MITLNILACNRVGLLPTILKQCQGYFDRIRVLDGSRDNGPANVAYRISKDIYTISYTWGYNLSRSLRHLLDNAEEGEWFFYIADDELPSQLLLEYLPSIIDECERTEKYMLGIPFTVRHDGFNSEDLSIYIHQCRAFDTTEKAKEYEVCANDKFRLGRCFKVFSETNFEGTTHEKVVGYPYERYNVEYPIIHIKDSDSFIRANLWTSVINPTGQGLKDLSLEAFIDGTKNSKLTGDELVIEECLRTKMLSPDFIRWMNTYSNSTNSVEFSWFAIYYFKYHPEDILSWFDFTNDTRFHLYFDMLHYHYKDSELITETILHREIKLKLLELGIKTIGDCRGRRPK